MSNPVRVVCLGILVLSLAGCGKKEPPAAAADGAAASAPEPAAAPAAGEPAATPAPAAQPQSTQPAPPPATGNGDEAVAGTVDEFMTGQLHIFIQEKGRLPVDFAEFAAARMDSIPRTPAGMVWAIDNENQQVKLAPAPVKSKR